MKLLLMLFLLMPSKAFAARALMEGTTAQGLTIFVDTNNGRVDISTSSYSGGVSNVGLYVSSNVAIGLTGCVIYSTGSLSCSNGTVGFWTASGANIYKNNSGNVGIGVTTPGVLLTIQKATPPALLLTSDGTDGIYLGANGGSLTKNWEIADENETNGLSFTPSTVNGGSVFTTPAMVIKSNSNVGINQNVPGAMLEVGGALNARSVKVTSPNTAGQSFGPLITAGTNSADESLNIQNAGGTSIAFFRGDGNIGMGTTVPGQKLTVSGGVSISGTGSPATGGALCLNASNVMSKCTSAVDAGGNCTCP